MLHHARESRGEAVDVADPAPRRSAWPAASVALVLVLLAAATIVWVAGPPPAALLRRLPAATSAPSAPATTPGPSATWPGTVIDTGLAVQATALRTGDEQAWLSVVDPAAHELVRVYQVRFRVLRAMLAADWSARTTAPASPAGTGRWQVNVAATFCLGTSTCAAARPTRGVAPMEVFTANTSWRLLPEGARLTAETPTSDGAAGSNALAPWVTDDLAVAVGSRVVVAAPLALSDRLAEAVAVGDQAGANADQFALGGHPGRYLCYLAGSNEWRAWFGGGLPDWATAYAPPTSRTNRAVVLNLGEADVRGLASALRHELGHVVTMRDASSATVPFWVAEGVAEWIDEWERPATAHPFLSAVRRYLRDVGIAELETMSPVADDPQWRVSAMYGLAYLSIRRLADTYGRGPVLEFIAARKSGDDVDRSAQRAFGIGWATLESDLITYLRGVGDVT